MGKKLSIGVSNIARKGKKGWVGVDNKARKIKKMWIGDSSGKARLFWSGLSKLFLGSASVAYPSGNMYSSEDGDAWQLGIKLPSIISVTYGEGFYYGINESELYRSEDGVTWTQISAPSPVNTAFSLVRFLNGKLFIIGKYHTSSNNLWYSSDGGENWSVERYKITVPTPNGTHPLDFQYGTANGKKGYYLLITNGDKYTYLYYWASEGYFAYQSAPLNIDIAPFTFAASKGAMSISGGNMRIILASSSNTYTYFCKYTGTFTQVTFISGGVGWVCSTPDYMICGINQNAYKFNGNVVTKAGSLSVNAASNTLYVGMFAAAFGNERVVAFGFYNGNACAIIYSDTYGETWTRAVLDTEIPSGYGFGYRCSMCYGEDGGGYYSE